MVPNETREGFVMVTVATGRRDATSGGGIPDRPMLHGGVVGDGSAIVA